MQPVNVYLPVIDNHPASSISSSKAHPEKEEAILIKQYAIQNAQMPEGKDLYLLEQRASEKIQQMDRAIEIKIQAEMIRQQEYQKDASRGLER